MMVQVTRERVKSLNISSSAEELIRSAIIAEMDATSLYQSQIENIDHEGSKRVLSHIRDEEKEHIAELMCLLISIDFTQRDKMYEEYPQLREFAEKIGEDCIIGKTEKELEKIKTPEKKVGLTPQEIAKLPMKERLRYAKMIATS